MTANRSIEKRIDRIESELARRIANNPDLTHDDLVKRLAFRLFKNGLKYLMEFLPAAERQPVHKFWSWLINPRAWNQNHATEPDPIPDEIQAKIFESAYNGGYIYLRSAAVIYDDPAMLARAQDLRLMDVPDLARIPFYGGKTPPGVHDPDLEYRDWQAFLKWYQDHDFGTFGPRTDFDPDHRFYDLQGYEVNYRINLARWLDVYGLAVVGEFIDLEKVNDLDRYLARREEEKHR